MKKLFIVESPGKAKTIKKYLGNDFTVTSTMGHIKDLPQKKLGVEINPPTLTMTYETMPGKEKTIKELKKYIATSDEIYLAPDADREGEIIAFHINDLIAKDIKENKNKKVYRVTYNEISKEAILESIKNKRDLDYAIIEAQQARRILDRLVGYKVSPVLWKKISKGLSAGRVQSVALKLICRREEEIKNFIIEEYWTVHGTINYEKNKIIADIFPIEKSKKSLNEEEAEKIINATKTNNWHIEDVKDREKKRKPLPPFITSSLQQSSYNLLHYNVQQTMLIAQQLYEGIALENDENSLPLITYMRTDSTRISEQSSEQARQYIEKKYGSDYLPKKSIAYTTKGKAQDAHEAIRPINVTITPESIKNKVKKEQYNLYNLIWTRFVACQMTDAIYRTRTINLIDESKQFCGKITGSNIAFDGFLKVYNTKEDEEDDKELPPHLEKGKIIIFSEINKKQHFTQPPARYSEATLVKELEQKGIGRPSTYAPILKTIRDRLYTELDVKKRFVPSALGMQVCEILEENMQKIMDYSFTAEMEKKLDEIAGGESTRNKLIFDFYDYLIPAVETFLGKKIEKKHTITELKCPEVNCNGELLIKFSKTGEFLGCSKFPTCKFTANFSRNEKEEIMIELKKKESAELLDILCAKCNKPMMKKMGRYGEFIACSGYPACTYIKQETTSALCLLCKKNHLGKKSWKGKIFWGCLGYPTCKFTINGDIIEKTCSHCQYPFYKKNGADLTCANKDCTEKIE